MSGLRVSAGFFSVPGAKPLLGRTFLPEEETLGKDHEVVLSYGLWKTRYGGDPALVGRTIRVDGADFTVIGVMPRGFVWQFWSGPRQLWVPVGYKLLTESLLLALAGGAAGLLLAALRTRVLFYVFKLDSLHLPLRPNESISMDVRVFAFALLVSCLTGVLFGVAPALSALRANVNEPLKEGGRTAGTGGRNRLR